MLELAQALLIGATIVVTLALVGYAFAFISAQTSKRDTARQKVSVATDGSEVVVDEDDAEPAAKREVREAKQSKRGVAWIASKLVIAALILVSASLLARAISTGHAPFANHYEFAVSFAWGMLLFQVYFDWRYKARALALGTLPVILAILVYSSTLSYEANPLVPALQNSPLLTLHVFTAALAYGAAVVSFGAGVMYLIAPYVKWKGWPRQELLDEIGYKAVVVTFPMLTIMIVLGAVWANVAWGRYWSWDPKETAALVTWLIYAGYLHARVIAGWRGRRSAWLLVLGFAAILFTYFGNLFFGGLHAYV